MICTDKTQILTQTLTSEVHRGIKITKTYSLKTNRSNRKTGITEASLIRSPTGHKKSGRIDGVVAL